MSLSRLVAIALAGVPLLFSACSHDEGSHANDPNAPKGGSSDEGGASGQRGGTGGTGGARASSGGTGGSSGGTGGSGGGAMSGGSGGAVTSGTGGSGSAGMSGAGGSTGGSTGTGGSTPPAGNADGGAPPASSTLCPGTPIVIDWTNGWMDPALNPAIHGAWYAYGDTNGTTYKPGKGEKVNTNCLTGTIAAAGWGAGFGFNVNQLAGSMVKTPWEKPPSKLCVEVEITGAALWMELPMTKVDVHAPPYGQVLKNGVNVVDLSKVTPTWTDPMKSPGTWNAADVAEVHLKVGKPGTDFKLCVKGLAVQ